MSVCVQVCSVLLLGACDEVHLILQMFERLFYNNEVVINVLNQLY